MGEIINEMKLNPLSNINRRQIKFCWIIDREKNIKKWISFTVKDNEQLEYMYNKLKPDNCYQGISIWMRPSTIENPTYLIQKMILDSDIFLEVDDSETSSHYESYKDVKFAIEWMLENKYEPLREKFIERSGGGFHAYFKSKVKLNPNARLREQQFKEEKKLIVEKLINLGVRLCKYTCLDILRVSRIPNSYNANRGVYSKEYSLKQFYSLESSLKKNNDRNRFPHKSGGNGRPRVIPQPLKLKANYLSNKVFKDYYIALMRFRNLPNLTEIQKKYKLGNLYILDYGNEYIALSLKVLNKRRVEKIMKNSRCINYNSFKKYNQNFLRVSEIITDKKEIYKDMPKPLKIFESNEKGMLSYKHADFLKDLGFKIDLDTKGIEKEVEVREWLMRT